MSQPRQILDAVVDVATIADHPIVAAPTDGKQIRVLAYTLVSAGANTVRWKSGTSNRSGAMTMAAASVIAANNEKKVFDCAQNAALVLTLTAAVQVSGHVSYELI